MKNSILLLLAIFALASCKKEESIAPQAAPSKAPVAAEVKTDSIPDNAGLKIQLLKDSINTDETLFVFRKSAKLNYDDDVDATYFQGLGQVGLSSITPDGKNLAIYLLPYTQGMSIGLNVRTQTGGSYTFKISYKNKIPSNVQIWVKDTYLKDSVNVCNGNFKFNVNKVDASSSDSKRFKLVIK